MCGKASFQAHKWQSWNLKPENLAPECVLITKESCLVFIFHIHNT
jgi:hypothetical protein